MILFGTMFNVLTLKFLQAHLYKLKRSNGNGSNMTHGNMNSVNPCFDKSFIQNCMTYLLAWCNFSICVTKIVLYSHCIYQQMFFCDNIL